MGSVVECLSLREQAHASRGLPNYMVLPNWLGALQEKGQYRRPGQYGGWLGRAYDPLNTGTPRWPDLFERGLGVGVAGLPERQPLGH